MPTTFERCNEEVRDLVDDLIRDHYPDLIEAGIRITLLFAYAEKDDNGEPKGAALKLHGYPCAATVKVNSYRDRVEGKGDATITIDGDVWPTTPNPRRAALLDHELYHLVVKNGEDGIATDGLGRPKLKVRLHDLVVGGFKEIAERHRGASIEQEHIQHCLDQTGQFLMFEIVQVTTA